MLEKMRTDEEFGKEAFHRYLLSASIQDVKWETGKEPPDFELACERGCFSVEITQIVRTVQVKGRRKSERFWEESISKLVEEMQGEGRAEGVQGVFSLDVEPIAELSKVRGLLQSRIFDYARDNELLVEAPQMEVWRDGVGSRWAIEKIGAGPLSLCFNYSSPDDFDWNGPDDIQQELDQLVADTFAKKRGKTSHLDNVVLVLIDTYGFGEPDQWLRSVERLHPPSHFCVIARAYGDYHCQILFDHSCGLIKVEKPWGDPRLL